MATRTHHFVIGLTVDAIGRITRADIEADLRALLSAVQEPEPYRYALGSGWWTNRRDAVVVDDPQALW